MVPVSMNGVMGSQCVCRSNGVPLCRQKYHGVVACRQKYHTHAAHIQHIHNKLSRGTGILKTNYDHALIMKTIWYCTFLSIHKLRMVFMFAEKVTLIVCLIALQKRVVQILGFIN